MYNDVFNEKAQEEYRRVFSKYFSKYGKIIHLKKGEQINIDADKYVALVLKGAVVTGVCSENGKRKDLFIKRNGEIFGDYNFFYTGVDFLYHEVKVECSICINPEEDFEKVANEFPEIYRYILSSAAEIFRIVTLELSNIFFNDSMGKIADALLRIAACSRTDNPKTQGEDGEYYAISNIYTHEELARNVGCSRQTITLHLNKLIEQNIIEFSDKKIVIKKPYELSKFVDKVY